MWTKILKAPPKWVFLIFVTPQELFYKSGSVTFKPLWCANFMRKTNEESREVFKDRSMHNTRRPRGPVE